MLASRDVSGCSSGSSSRKRRTVLAPAVCARRGRVRAAGRASPFCLGGGTAYQSAGRESEAWRGARLGSPWTALNRSSLCAERRPQSAFPGDFQVAVDHPRMAARRLKEDTIASRVEKGTTGFIYLVRRRRIEDRPSPRLPANVARTWRAAAPGGCVSVLFSASNAYQPSKMPNWEAEKLVFSPPLQPSWYM